jgi:branched-chain amino acid transport system substrate-binding protein
MQSGNEVSRRRFLEIAGASGAVVALGGGLGAVVAGCGQGTTTTTVATTATTTTPSSDGSSTSGSEAATTSVSAAAEEGREVKIGFITPLTGALASFGIPDKYCVDRWTEAVADGLVCGDGKKHKVTFLTRDTQSDSSRSSQVAGDLVSNDNVDMVLAASTSDVTLPAADQCEALGTPFISTDTPNVPWFMARKGDPKVGFKWTYHFFWGTPEVVSTFLDIWAQVPSNKTVGLMCPNDPDGQAWRGLWPPLFEKNGYKVVDGGAFADGTEDYTSIISQFRKGAVEVIAAVMVPSDFVNFTKQSAQQGFVAKVSTGGKAMLFPQTAEAIGSIGYGITCEQWWGPTFPFKSSLTGETCQQLADDFEKRTGEQWTQPIEHYALFEVGADVLKRATNLDDKETIRQALAATNMAGSIVGKLDWTAPVAENTAKPYPNVVTTPLVGGQWVKGQSHPFDILICSNVAAPDIAIQVKEKPLADFRS